MTALKPILLRWTLPYRVHHRSSFPSNLARGYTIAKKNVPTEEKKQVNKHVNTQAYTPVSVGEYSDRQSKSLRVGAHACGTNVNGTRVGACMMGRDSHAEVKESIAVDRNSRRRMFGYVVNLCDGVLVGGRSKKLDRGPSKEV